VSTPACARWRAPLDADAQLGVALAEVASQGLRRLRVDERDPGRAEPPGEREQLGSLAGRGEPLDAEAVRVLRDHVHRA
jgi:hypothetical protein